MTTNLKLQPNSVNHIFNPNPFFFFLLTGDNNITMLYTYYFQILHHLQAMKMTFLELFLIFTFKNSKLAEKWTNLEKEKKQKKKLNYAEFVEFVFSKSVGRVCQTCKFKAFETPPSVLC